MFEMVQGTDEWLNARAGMITASRIVDMMTKLKGGGRGATATNYMAELVAERLTGVPSEHFQSSAMKWGTEHEPEARSLYAFMVGTNVEEVGFVVHPEFDFAGASPDGLVGDNGLIEIKCPNTATHISTLLSKSIDRKYILQMQWQMECTKRDWCDFVSYDPRMPHDMQIFIKRVRYDENIVQSIKDEMVPFNNEINQMIKELNSAKK